VQWEHTGIHNHAETEVA